MMPSESAKDFFIIGLRIVRPSIAETFSFAGEDDRKRGRFPMELPNTQLLFFQYFDQMYWSQIEYQKYLFISL
jgi:hypothetical protein